MTEWFGLVRSFINEILIQILSKLMQRTYHSNSFEKVRYRYFATRKIRLRFDLTDKEKELFKRKKEECGAQK